jgi:hypothetical protein
MNHLSNYRIQQQTANENAAFVGERGKYKIPGLACRSTIHSVGLHAGYCDVGLLYFLLLMINESSQHPWPEKYKMKHTSDISIL